MSTSASYAFPRRSLLAAKARPVPSSASDAGSGTVGGGGASGPFAATNPVLPLDPMMSAAKKYPPAFATKLFSVMPVSVTPKFSGPGFVLLPPAPHPVGTTQSIVYMNAPNAPLASGPSHANPDVSPLMFAPVMAGSAPLRLNSMEFPAPVDTNPTPLVNVTSTWTKFDPPRSSSVTVPNGPAPHVPVQPS